MSGRILHLKLLPPKSINAWRWYTVPKHRLSPLHKDNLIYTTSTAFSSTCSNKLSGRFLDGCINHSRYKQSGCLWSNVASQTFLPSHCEILRTFSINPKKDPDIKTEVCDQPEEETKKLGLVQKFRKMYRDYWYVLVPVHLVTSIGWFGSFYYLAKSGVDVVALLESMGVSQKLIDPLKDSSAGYIALAYALYKIATPIRYTVTLGGTTLSIKYLKEYGYIKPIPPKAKLKEMYQERKDNLIERRDNLAEEFRQKKERLKERRESFMEDYRKRSKKE